jgi:hypothetical protein
MHVNDFIGSLPKVEKKKVWRVIDANGETIQYVGASNNSKASAEAYIASKYPGRDLTLVFSHFNGLVAIPR